ncbi:MAG: hypothetical protein JXA23_02820, partial [Bacteroidales bacterium]|nr:hypothetical protein [Bacteroidales bacterium]
ELLKNHGVTDEQMTDKLLEVSVPDKRNGPELELIDLKRIKKHLTDPGFDVENALREHWKKYAYLGYRDVFSSGYSIDFFRSSLQEKDLNEMGLTHPPLLEFNFSPDELQVIHLLKEFVWFRNYRTERFFEGMFFLEPLWKQLSLSFGLGEHDLFYYLTDEVSKLFTHGDKVPVADLEQRKQGSALLLDDNHFLLLTGDLLKQKESAIQEVDESASQEIKGMVVCRGECQGPVSIVHNDSELDKVNDGDILVTGMTTPDYIPALRKAAAFVTDEGGVTCHAAIVAREMKKPCIVGTKHATQILKDRELVQVDANAGIVKIIS